MRRRNLTLVAFLLLITATLMLRDPPARAVGIGLLDTDEAQAVGPTSGSRGEDLERAAVQRKQPQEPVPDATMPRFVLRVVREGTGKPIPDARVALRRPQEASPALSLGSTDTEGRLEREVPPGLVELSVTAPGGPTVLRGIILLERGTEYQLAIPPPARLVGTVHTPAAVPEGLRVLALPGSRPSLQDASHALHAPGTLETEVTPDGSFAFDDVNPGTTYFLVAGGAGLFQRGRITAAPEDNEVTLDLDHGYFAAVRLVEADGTPVRATRSVGAGSNTSGMLHDEVGSSFSGPRLSPWLSGIDIDFDRSVSAQRLYLGVSRTRLPAMGPMVLHGSLPGYEPFQLDFDLLPVDGTEFAIREVPLQRTASGFGFVEILWEGRSEEAGGNWGATASLKLMAPSGETLAYPTEISSTGSRVGPVPAGWHQVCVTTVDGFRHPIEGWISLEVEPERTTTVRVPLMRTGGLELRLTDSSGAPFLGEVRLAIGESRVVDEFALEGIDTGTLGHIFTGRSRTTLGPPYRIDGLLPGPTKILMIHPGTTRRRVPVEILPGQIEVVELQLE